MHSCPGAFGRRSHVSESRSCPKPRPMPPRVQSTRSHTPKQLEFRKMKKVEALSSKPKYVVKYVGETDNRFGVSSYDFHNKGSMQKQRTEKINKLSQEKVVHSQACGRYLASRRSTQREAMSTLGKSLFLHTTDAQLMHENRNTPRLPFSTRDTDGLPSCTSQIAVPPTHKPAQRPKTAGTVSQCLKVPPKKQRNRAEARGQVAQAISLFRMQFRREWYPGKEFDIDRLQANLIYSMERADTIMQSGKVENTAIHIPHPAVDTEMYLRHLTDHPTSSNREMTE